MPRPHVGPRLVLFACLVSTPASAIRQEGLERAWADPSAVRSVFAFFIKMFPLKSHPDARRKAQAIICAGSAALLQASVEGKPIPDPTCETDQIEKNEALAQALGIRSTPTLVFPDGRVAPGYKTVEKILAYLEGDRRSPK